MPSSTSYELKQHFPLPSHILFLHGFLLASWGAEVIHLKMFSEAPKVWQEFKFIQLVAIEQMGTQSPDSIPGRVAVGQGSGS